MNGEFWVLLGFFGFFVAFLSFLFWSTLSTIRTAHQDQVESLRTDKKALHALLKECQNRIHASSLNDYLTLQAHNGGTELRDGPPPGMSYSRSDAIEAEIAARQMGGVE